MKNKSIELSKSEGRVMMALPFYLAETDSCRYQYVSTAFQRLLLFPPSGPVTRSRPLFVALTHCDSMLSPRLFGRLFMIMQLCLDCSFHQFRREEREMVSYCEKENCWAEYSKCIQKKTLNKFFQEFIFSLATPENQSFH